MRANPFETLKAILLYSLLCCFTGKELFTNFGNVHRNASIRITSIEAIKQ